MIYELNVDDQTTDNTRSCFEEMRAQGFASSPREAEWRFLQVAKHEDRATELSQVHWDAPYMGGGSLCRTTKPRPRSMLWNIGSQWRTSNNVWHGQIMRKPPTSIGVDFEGDSPGMCPPPIIEKSLCFRQLYPPVAPQYFGSPNIFHKSRPASRSLYLGQKVESNCQPLRPSAHPSDCLSA